MGCVNTCEALPITSMEAHGATMIELTRLNGHKLYINSDLLKFAESSPDTMLTLVTGEKIVVLETCEEVIGLAAEFHARRMENGWPNPGSMVNVASLRSLQDARI